MKQVFTHENRLIVENAKNILEMAEISVVINNQYAASIAGDLSPLDVWPELWVNDDQEKKARALLSPLRNPVGTETWTCNRCQEENENTFDWCWQCQHQQED